MTRLSVGLLILLLAASARAGGEKQSDDKKPPEPAEEYQALLKEYRAELGAFNKAYREAKTDDEKQKAFAEKYPKADKYASRFIELAEKNAKEPFAIDALIWVVEQGGGKSLPRVLELLERDHLSSDKLGKVCQRFSFGTDKQTEGFLRTLAEKSPHVAVQGKALLALGQSLKNRPDMAKEVEAIFERAEKEFGDVKLQFYGTIAAKAKSELFDIRFLSVGKTAPDVEGQDQDGKKFKLSDYRGKVVLLDFWSQF